MLTKLSSVTNVTSSKLIMFWVHSILHKVYQRENAGVLCYNHTGDHSPQITKLLQLVAFEMVVLRRWPGLSAQSAAILKTTLLCQDGRITAIRQNQSTTDWRQVGNYMQCFCDAKTNNYDKCTTCSQLLIFHSCKEAAVLFLLYCDWAFTCWSVSGCSDATVTLSKGRTLWKDDWVGKRMLSCSR